MFKTILFFIITYLLVVYWAAFLVVNPLEHDLKILCDYKKNHIELRSIESQLMSSEVKTLVKYLTKMPTQDTQEFIKDFARSKKITWDCPLSQ